MSLLPVFLVRKGSRKIEVETTPRLRTQATAGGMKMNVEGRILPLRPTFAAPEPFPQKYY